MAVYADVAGIHNNVLSTLGAAVQQMYERPYLSAGTVEKTLILLQSLIDAAMQVGRTCIQLSTMVWSCKRTVYKPDPKLSPPRSMYLCMIIEAMLLVLPYMQGSCFDGHHELGTAIATMVMSTGQDLAAYMLHISTFLWAGEQQWKQLNT